MRKSGSPQKPPAGSGIAVTDLTFDDGNPLSLSECSELGDDPGFYGLIGAIIHGAEIDFLPFAAVYPNYH